MCNVKTSSDEQTNPSFTNQKWILIQIKNGFANGACEVWHLKIFPAGSCNAYYLCVGELKKFIDQKLYIYIYKVDSSGIDPFTK